ncbi:hypothetical protein BDW22DRAFT_64950 [Trametopsis cervina]|nr:hypothetical protein BDW22DRAFT_64950 [Trametopsis cervina]
MLTVPYEYTPNDEDETRRDGLKKRKRSQKHTYLIGHSTRGVWRFVDIDARRTLIVRRTARQVGKSYQRAHARQRYPGNRIHISRSVQSATLCYVICDMLMLCTYPYGMLTLLRDNTQPRDRDKDKLSPRCLLPLRMRIDNTNNNRTEQTDRQAGKAG